MKRVTLALLVLGALSGCTPHLQPRAVTSKLEGPSRAYVAGRLQDWSAVSDFRANPALLVQEVRSGAVLKWDFEPKEEVALYEVEPGRYRMQRIDLALRDRRGLSEGRTAGIPERLNPEFVVGAGEIVYIGNFSVKGAYCGAKYCVNIDWKSDLPEAKRELLRRDPNLAKYPIRSTTAAGGSGS
jgi:hypothetical protein